MSEPARVYVVEQKMQDGNWEVFSLHVSLTENDAGHEKECLETVNTNVVLRISPYFRNRRRLKFFRGGR